MIKLLIADDHQMMRDGLKAMLREEDDIQMAGEANNGIDVLEFLNNNDVDVVILDINMPILDGVEVCKKMKKLHPDVKVLALTMYDEGGLITSMVKNGAKGYILKNTGKEKLVQAVRTIYNGGTYFPDGIKDTLFSSLVSGGKSSSNSILPKLTRREKEIIDLIVKEHTTCEIAEKLFISEKTVETHRKHLLEKFNVRNTAGLVRIAVEKGLVD